MPGSYLEAHRTVRETTGFGAGKGPYVALPDGFSIVEPLKAEIFNGFLNGADRVIVEKRFFTQPLRQEAELVPNSTLEDICLNVQKDMDYRCVGFLGFPSMGGLGLIDSALFWLVGRTLA